MRPELSPLPDHMKRLPIDKRGYPVPAFVETMPDGSRDFRFMSRNHFQRCIKEKVCWVCGQNLGAYIAFAIGPMCAINRTTSEPACHRDCAEWSAQNCPFLSRPHMVRREDELTDESRKNVSGVMIDRNPGVSLIWITKSYRIFKDETGKPLIQVGDPEEVLWYAEGRPATRDEVLASIESGLPILLKMAELDGPDAVAELYDRRARIEKLLPV